MWCFLGFGVCGVALFVGGEEVVWYVRVNGRGLELWWQVGEMRGEDDCIYFSSLFCCSAAAKQEMDFGGWMELLDHTVSLLFSGD